MMKTATGLLLSGVSLIATSAAFAQEAAPAADVEAGKAKAAKADAKGEGAARSGPVDPMQWWGALTQQFQEIAANAMKDAAQQTAVDAARNMATGAAKEAIKAATGVARAASNMVVAPGTRASKAPAPASGGKGAQAAKKKKPAARKAAPAKTRSKG